jgi:hypothetical protein
MGFQRDGPNAFRGGDRFKMSRVKFGRTGMSLLEVTIAGVILMTVILLVFGILHQSQTAAASGQAMAEAEERGRKALDACKTELLFARLVLGDFPTGTKNRIRYQIPSVSGALLYGYPDSGGTFQAGWSAVIRFVEERVILEPEAADVAGAERFGYDLNRNGSVADAFSVGKIVRETYNGTDSIASLQGSVTISGDVLLRRPDPRADMDGDGAGDPLFELLDFNGGATIPSPGTVAMVRVNVWHGLFGPNRTAFHLRNNRQDIQFRNPQ